ncbi:MAG: protease pro-enzyme activation domain-containing protein, partial [Acidimicrobiales bacterium]
MARAADVLFKGAVAVLTGGLLLGTSVGLTWAPAGADPVTTQPHLAHGIAGRLQSSWSHLLERSEDLGPSRATVVRLLARLGSPADTEILERWARSAHLRVERSAGEQWAVVSGSPDDIDHALRVRVDEYRAPGGRRFYGTLEVPAVPAYLRGEVRAFGRISSYLELKSFDVPDGGLTPSDVATAYDAKPLLGQGMRGQG